MDLDSSGLSHRGFTAATSAQDCKCFTLPSLVRKSDRSLASPSRLLMFKLPGCVQGYLAGPDAVASFVYLPIITDGDNCVYEIPEGDVCLTQAGFQLTAYVGEDQGLGQITVGNLGCGIIDMSRTI